MTDDPGPDLRWLTSPFEVDGQVRAALVGCWRDVANAGGAVGFAQRLPVDDDVVGAEVDAFLATLDPRLCRVLVAETGGELAGWLLLTASADPVTAHWGRVTRVQTALPFRGTGVARALMTEVARAARDDLGLDQLRLEVRGAVGLEDFYARFGWRVVGAWPGALQIGPGDRRDEVLLQLDLRGRAR
jgi:GNAT superfamily N-acetyltransferase